MAADEAPLLHRGSCILPQYELRITARCLEIDLAMSPDTTFKDAMSHPIVSAFVKKRRADPGSGKTVGPAAGGRTLYHLGQGDDHRGATWFDAQNAVVWLCAYGLHRSGKADDAFQIFEALIKADQIRPTAADYRRLGRDRIGRLVDLGPKHGQASVKEAAAKPGIVRTVRLAGQIPVRLVTRPINGFIEVTIAFPHVGLNSQRIFFVIRCFAGSSDDMWENVGSLQGEPLAEGELGFVIWRETLVP